MNMCRVDGPKLKRLRTLYSWTMTKLVKETGISQPTLMRYESESNQSIQCAKLAKLAEAYGTTPEMLSDPNISADEVFAKSTIKTPTLEGVKVSAPEPKTVNTPETVAPEPTQTYQLEAPDVSYGNLVTAAQDIYIKHGLTDEEHADLLQAIREIYENERTFA